MRFLIIFAVLLIAGLVALVLIRGVVGRRTGTAAGGCEAASVDWTEALYFFYLTQMMDETVPTYLGRAPIVLDEAGRVNVIGTNTVGYDAEGRLISVGIGDLTYDDVSGRAIAVGLVPLQYDEAGRIVAVGSVPVTYDAEGRVDLIGEACARYDESNRLTGVGFDPIIYP